MKDTNPTNKQMKEKWLENLLFVVAEDGAKFHQGKLKAENEVGRRRIAYNIIVERLRRTALVRTRRTAKQIKELCQSENPRDRYQFYKGYQKAREIIGGIKLSTKKEL